MSSSLTDQDLLLGTVAGQHVYLPQNAKTLSLQHARDLARELGSHDLETSMAAYWSLTSRAQQWQMIADTIGWEQLRQAHVIEVGSGLGLFTLVGRLLGINVTGIEYSADRYSRSLQIAQCIFNANYGDAPLINAPAEALPIPTASVDLVVSFQTLEHVADLQQAIAEMARVLRPSGRLLAQAPNYQSFYEAHYGTVAPLALGKNSIRRYLKWQKRPVAFLEHLQWLSPESLQAMLRTYEFSEIHISRIMPASKTAEELPITPQPLPFRFRRGAFGYRVAFALAKLADFLDNPNYYPQLQVWATRTN